MRAGQRRLMVSAISLVVATAGSASRTIDAQAPARATGITPVLDAHQHLRSPAVRPLNLST